MADEIEDWIQAPLSIPSCPVANNVDPPSDDWRKKSTSSVPDCSDTFNTRKTMTEWQQQCGTINERDDYILKHRLWTDLTITVGNVETGIKIFEAHRLMLSKSSAVFARMLYKQGNVFEEETTISLPDIRPELFEFVLKKMYGETLDIESAETAKAVLTLMKTFDLSINDDEQCWQHLSTDEINDIIGEHPAKKRKVKRKPVRAWQKEADTMAKRDKHILVKRIWTDCTFRVGENNCKTFHAHRIVLSKTSPVFAAMLFSELAKKGEVVDIPDVTPKAFSCFLRYAYTGKLRVDLETFINSGNIWDFLYLAKKYLLPDRLIEQCRAWIFFKIYSDQFWNILMMTEEYEEMQLYESCLQVLSQFTTYCLETKSFTNASLHHLLFLVKQEELPCQEYEIYEAFVKWAKAKCIDMGLEISPENIKEKLSSLLPFIRFGNMTYKDFLKGPINSGMFSETTCFQMLKYMIDPETETAPDGFSTAKTRTKKSVSSQLFVYGCHPDDINFLSIRGTPVNTYTMLTSHDGRMHFEDCWLLGVKVRSQVKPKNCQSDYYNEDLTILFYNESNIVATSRYTASVEYDSVIDVPFDKPINICTLEQKSTSVITIIPHKSGCYPYKMKNKVFNKLGTFMEKRRVSLVSVRRQGFIICNAYASSLRSSKLKCEKHISDVDSFNDGTFYYNNTDHSFVRYFVSHFD